MAGTFWGATRAMKVRSAAFFLLICAGCLFARADVLVTGYASNRDVDGTVCDSSGTSSSSLFVSCGDKSKGYSSVSADVGATSGSASVDFYSWLEPPIVRGISTYTTASFSISIDGTYLLTGGTGYGYVDWTVDGYLNGEGGGGNFGPCEIELDGITENCDPKGDASGSFYIPYNTPLELTFDASYSGAGIDGDGGSSGLSYSFGDLRPVPEPGSFTLLGSGLLGLGGLVSRRVFKGKS
jgi:hypothetical protein